ncbi:MAG TPA: GAF domain-containing protein [Candidatus Binatia bacterium]|nr:GAF domain-containing protein [Candidatus Binatia bacterium]
MTTAASKVRDRQDVRLEAARRRLRESSGQAETLEALREIVTGFLGCEEIGLFTLDHEKSRLFWSFGIDARSNLALASLLQSGLERLMQGEPHVTEAADPPACGNSHAPLQVFLPIRIEGQTVAVLAMLKLLPQKLGFDQSDYQLFELISGETGRALFDAGTDFHTRAARKNR